MSESPKCIRCGTLYIGPTPCVAGGDYVCQPDNRAPAGAQERRPAHSVAQGLRATAVGLRHDGYEEAPGFLREAADLIDALSAPHPQPDRAALVEHAYTLILETLTLCEGVMMTKRSGEATDTARNEARRLAHAILALSAPAEAREPEAWMVERQKEGEWRWVGASNHEDEAKRFAQDELRAGFPARVVPLYRRAERAEPVGARGRRLDPTLDCLCTTVRNPNRDSLAHREPSPRCPVHGAHAAQQGEG